MMRTWIGIFFSMAIVSCGSAQSEMDTERDVEGENPALEHKKNLDESPTEDDEGDDRENNLENKKTISEVKRLIARVTGRCFGEGMNIENIALLGSPWLHEIGKSFEIDRYKYTVISTKNRLDLADHTFRKFDPVKDYHGVRALHPKHLEPLSIASVTGFHYVYHADVMVEIKDFQNIRSQDEFEFFLKTQSALFLKDAFATSKNFQFLINGHEFYIAEHDLEFKKLINKASKRLLNTIMTIEVILDVPNISVNNMWQKNINACKKDEETEQ